MVLARLDIHLELVVAKKQFFDFLSCHVAMRKKMRIENLTILKTCKTDCYIPHHSNLARPQRVDPRTIECASSKRRVDHREGLVPLRNVSPFDSPSLLASGPVV